MSEHRRAHIHAPAHLGDKIADKVTAAIGSWRFIIIQSTLLFFWLIFNIVGIFGLRWDPMPFILLNLMLSFQAAYTGPVVMMSQNRQAAKDRLRDDTEAQEVADILNNHQELLDINRKLYALQQQQMEILTLLKEQPPTPRKRGYLI